MAFFSSVAGNGVGPVEIFRNPFGREWLELQRHADPIDGMRGYLIGCDVYIWGSLPLHRDLGPLLRPEIARDAGAWLAIQINPKLARCVLSECIGHDGRAIKIDNAESVLERSIPIRRLLGQDFTVSRLAQELTDCVPDSEKGPSELIPTF